MTNNKSAKKILAILFVGVMLLGFIKNGSYALVGQWSDYLMQKDVKATDFVTVTQIDSNYSGDFWHQREFIELNGFMAKLFNNQGLYSDMDMYITSDGYIESSYKPTSTDYEVEQLIAFRDFLEENGINLLYVSEPTKYTDDGEFYEEFGIESYGNRNADKFMDRIRQANINCIDLRDNMVEEGIEAKDMFYRTDHHWNIPAGLWATGHIAEGLNEYCGYDIDMSLYDTNNFDSVYWEKSWLGEQGRKVGKSYVGLDDYTKMTPKYETSFLFKNDDGSTTAGDFSGFISDGIYNTENDVYENLSWHYSYSIEDCINNNIDNGKVLLLADSYAMATEPFLALGVHEIDCLFLRQMDPRLSIRDYILENGYDTVVMAYAQIAIGSHDDGTNANYNAFRLD